MSPFGPSYTTFDTPGAKLEAKLGEECEAMRFRNQRNPRYIVLGCKTYALIYQHLIEHGGHNPERPFTHYSEPPIRVLVDELKEEALDVLS